MLFLRQPVPLVGCLTVALMGCSGSSAGESGQGGAPEIGGSSGNAGTGGASQGGSAGSAASAGAGTQGPGGSSSGSGGGSGAEAQGGASSGGSSGTGPNGGTGGGGGNPSGGASGAAGTAGSGGDPQLGFACPSLSNAELRCLPGEFCLSCVIDAQVEYRCAPDPTEDPDGHATATQGCGVTNVIAGCDGPEDCSADRFCVHAARRECAEHLVIGNCCLTCGAEPECTLCRADEDCGPGARCTRELNEPSGVKGCELIRCDEAQTCPQSHECDGLLCRVPCGNTEQCAPNQTCDGQYCR